MKKLFTLLLLAFMTVGVYADGLTTVLIGETALNWSNTDIPKEYFTGIKDGDILYFSSDENLKIIGGGSSWTWSYDGISGSYTLATGEAEALSTNGLGLQSSSPVHYVGWGSALAYNEPTILTLNGNGDQSIPLTDAIKSSCKIFDKIVFTVEPNNSGETTLNVKKNYDKWDIYYTSSAITGTTNITWTIDQKALADVRDGKVWVGEGGNNPNLKITAIKYYSCSTSNTVLFEPSVKSYIQLESIPSNATVKYDRAFQWGWNTLCLPFDATVSDIHSSAKAYEFTAADASSITFTQISGTTLTAGTPYLVNVDTNEATSATFTGVNVTATSAGSTSEINGLTFKGNYEAGFEMTDKYGVAYEDGWCIMKGGTNATGKAFSAYFEGTVPSQARGFNIIIDDGTTKINTVEKVEEGDGEIYNLMGVRTSAPRKGLYIKNGKKYIVK